MEDKMFDKIKITLASDEDVRQWSHGEVKKPETINYRTLKPEKDGLFCEKIFGPTKDWECHCGKYKKVRYKGIICDRCGVEITRKNVRRERLGHIELVAPVAHIWFFKSIPNRIALLLNASPKALERVIYFAAYIITESNVPTLKEGDILSETEYIQTRDEYKAGDFKAETGAEAIEKLLKRVDLEKERKIVKEELLKAPAGKRPKLTKRLEAIESFIVSKNKPEWMVKNVIPVIPPDLRPMVQLDGGRFATADLNDLYRRVINRNNRLKRLMELKAPEIIIKNEKRMLQESVDGLFDNTKKGKPVTGAGNRPLKSLSDILKGKSGRFRQNLLGKRVDYSGRSVIVIGPELKLNQCGLPKDMAVELFKPFIMRELIKAEQALNIKAAKKMVERKAPEIWEHLETVIKDHPVLLNRAPTLHRLSIQGFEPVILEGKAIKLHPLVCAAFNADFDGDQMAVHVPLSPEAQAETRYLMLSTHNLIKPKDGTPITTPSQDIIIGAYYLTSDKDGEKGEGMVFSSPEEALLAYDNDKITLKSKIKVRVKNAEGESAIIDATAGKLIFNEGIPQDLGYVDRTDPETKFNLEISFPTKKKNLEDIVSRCIETHGTENTVEVLDFMKAIGFKYSTIAGITVSASDVSVPEEKADIIKEAQIKIDGIVENYQLGLLSEKDKVDASVKVWKNTKNKISKVIEENFNDSNSMHVIISSGARGNLNQLTQISGMRGLMMDTNNKEIETPVKSAFIEGLDALEYFISSHGARKGLADTALRTSKAGYLTRRLVDAAQDIIVREEDCETEHGVTVRAIINDGSEIEGLKERIIGRFPVEDVIKPKSKKVLAHKGELISEKAAEEIANAGIEEVKVRSVVTCNTKNGICRKCYGKSLAGKGLPVIGETIGIIAAQAIGEPGTQLTMRTFHAGGVAGADVTQGLPRVEELFEARRPKGMGVISEIDGKVTVKHDKEGKKLSEIIVKGKDETKTYLAIQKILPEIEKGIVDKNGKVKPATVTAGDPLTEGALYPKDVLEVGGVDKVYNYILTGIQVAYRGQEVDINDKHVEILIRQMLGKVRILDSGDSMFRELSIEDKREVVDANEKLVAEGKKPAKYVQILLGVSKSSLETKSFLSAASFQETVKVLTDAAIKGKVDELIGIKENVIIGKLIPAGTGMARYKNMTTNTKLQDEALKRVQEEKDRLEEEVRKHMQENI